MDEKDLVQLNLYILESAPKPKSIWRHYKGGKYEVVCCSIREDTLEPLVTYRSLARGYLWTRALANWLEAVIDPNSDYLAPTLLSRFTEVTRVDGEDDATAIDEEANVS